MVKAARLATPRIGASSHRTATLAHTGLAARRQ